MPQPTSPEQGPSALDKIRLVGVLPGASGLVIGEGSIEVPTSLEDLDDDGAVDADGYTRESEYEADYWWDDETEGDEDEDYSDPYEDLDDGDDPEEEEEPELPLLSVEVAEIFAEEAEINEFNTLRIARAALIRRDIEVDCTGDVGDDDWGVDLPSGYHFITRPLAARPIWHL
ncbi:MAG TPA: hypothetical protein VG604_02700 [Candidatus Saccharimonadales bacterium]|nr:hypothetical protein [Candidatus Saccharimonadales bacterium]